ncbi:MAG: hypothetical protein IJ155_04585 [Prevotella sp.]|nr:hypothetical protein [Prevotella sp.]
MKKLFLSLVAAIVAATATYAQSSMLATLSHEGNISTYYGVSALKDAYTAAANGDIITLSSGSFNAVDIAKGITIRGAGMAIDSITKTEPTIISGNFKIAIPTSVTDRLILEGLYSNHTITVSTNFNNGTFLKSRFKTITYNQNMSGTKASVSNLTMVHCKVADNISIYANSSVSCINCFINRFGASTSSNFDFLNCVVGNNFGSYLIGFSSFKNSILISVGSTAILPSDAVVYNCVGINSTSKNLFTNIPNTSNIMKDYESVFKTYTGTYNDDVSFELTDTAKTTLLGLDGTQVGMFGGNMPFDATPTNPQITKCNVAAKSTADGKLSVDITVNGAE